MTATRIKELREASGLSQEELGSRVGATKFKISRIENEETKLDLDLAVKIADALDVTLAELLSAMGHRDGLAEDAEPYKAGPHDPLYRLADTSRALALYQVTSAVLDEAGIFPGDVLLIDMSPEAVATVAPLAIVIVQLYSREEMLEATTLLRQFVPPALLITNSRTANANPISMNATDAHIKGVVISRHQKIPGLRS